jgi:hypothetical protein
VLSTVRLRQLKKDEVIKRGLTPVLKKANPSKVQPNLGQLALKEEAAGKVRVFAMVDV